MKHVYTHDNVVVLNSAKNILAQHNIDSFIKNEDISQLNAQHGINNAFGELWVFKDLDFALASEIIDKEIENPIDAPPWVCNKCEEQNEGSFELCWKCQTEKLTTE